MLRVKLIGAFEITLAGRRTGRWERPPARWLCQLVLSSPGRRVTREAAHGALFSELGRARASVALSKALSLARAALAPFGPRGEGLLLADRWHVWADLGGPFEVDLDLERSRLNRALNASPGLERDDLLSQALAGQENLFEDGPSYDWAERQREHLEWERQDARLALARDRARGMGRSGPGPDADAWANCLAHDPTCEEAATALIRLYRAQKRHAQAESTYRQCREAFGRLGLTTSPAFEEAYSAGAPPLTGPSAAFISNAAPEQSPRNPRSRTGQ